MSISNERFRQILREETKRSLATRRPLYESIKGRSFLIIENLSNKELSDKMESDEGREEVKKSLWEKFRDSTAVDIGLDILGLALSAAAAPASVATFGASEIIAMIPDVLNAVRKFARGDTLSGVFSLMCAVPIAGDAFAGFIAAKNITFAGGKVTLETIKLISTFCKTHGKAAKAVRLSSASIMKVVAKYLPEAKDHHKDITDMVTVMTSGDEEEMIKAVKKSGANIIEKEISKKLDAPKRSKSSKKSGSSDNLPREDNLSESQTVIRKLEIIMGR